MNHLPFALSSILSMCVPLAAQGTGLKLVTGVDAYLDVPYDPSIVPRSGITIEAWVTYDDASLGVGWRWPTIVRQNSVPQSEVYMLRVDAGNTNSTVLKWQVRTTSGNFQTTWGFTPGQLLQWTHLAGTYDGSALRIFVNGTEVASAAATGALLDTGNTLRIGNGDLSAPGIEEWNGELDEVRLWPFARTAAEIQSTMHLELTLVPVEVSTWNLNGSGADSSGTNNAAPVNSPTFAANTLTLRPIAFGATAFGTATAGCLGSPRMVMGTFAQVGSGAFALGTIRGTATGSGVLWFGISNVQTPIRFLGLDLWIDPTQLNLIVPIPGGPLGFTRIPMPVPNQRSLGGQTFVTQTIWAELTCATPLFSSTPLTFVIAP